MKPEGAKKGHPLLLLHGWPGSVFEFFKMIPLLTTPDENGLAFELIIANLPGFGWSQAPLKPGLDPIHMARIFGKMMARLGHDKFFVHGGDWGSIIGKAMAILYPGRVKGLHITASLMKPSFGNFFRLAIGGYFPGLVYENPDKTIRWIQLAG